MPKIRTIEVDDLLITSTEKFEVKAILADGGLALQERYANRSRHMARIEFEEAYAAGEIVIKKTHAPDRHDREPLRHLAEEPDAEYSDRERIRQLILLEYDAAPANLSDEALRAVIRSAKLPPELCKIDWRPSPGTLRRDLRRCGEAGRRSLRRIRRRSGGPRSRVDARIVRMLETTVSWYYDKPWRSIADAYERVHNVVQILNNRSARVGNSRALAFPSSELVRTYIRRNESYDFLVRKCGEKHARERYKGIAEGRKAERPLDVVMIDATQIDTILVFAGTGDERRLLGRPTLTVAIDLCTRSILGIFITFEPASIYAITNCIKHMFMPKAQWFKERCPDIDEEWDAYGKPFLLILDNGLENVGASLQDALRDLGVNVEWAPVKTPQYKAYIERFFDTLNVNLFHKLPGGLPGDITSRRELEIDPEKMASVTIDRLESLVGQFIVDVYHKEYHRGLGDIPLRRWKKLTGIHGIDIVDDLSAIDEACGYAVNAVLTRQGIQCMGLRFHDTAVTTSLLEALLPTAARGHRARAINRVDVKVKFDPSDISRINVWNKQGRCYARLPNVQKRYSAGVSLWLHKTLMAWAKQEQLAFCTEEERVQARRRFLRKVESAGAVSGRADKRIGRHMQTLANVEYHEAEPRHDGNSVSVPVETGMAGRADGGARPDGFLRGRAKMPKKMRGKNAQGARKEPYEKSLEGPDPVWHVEDPEAISEMIRSKMGWS